MWTLVRTSTSGRNRMAATLFGLAAKTEAGEPDPDRVRVWGMEIPDGATQFK